MGIFGKYICMGFFAFALLAGFAAVSEAAEPDAYAIQQQLDAKFAQLDNELASPARQGAFRPQPAILQ